MTALLDHPLQPNHTIEDVISIAACARLALNTYEVTGADPSDALKRVDTQLRRMEQHGLDKDIAAKARRGDVESLGLLLPRDNDL